MTDASELLRLAGLNDAALASILARFNGGLVDVPDAANARGFTTRYMPIEALRTALRAIASTQEQVG